MALATLPLRDRDIREPVLVRVASKPGLVVEEMGLLRGEYRVDVALVDDYLTGFEIKSELDDDLPGFLGPKIPRESPPGLSGCS